MNLKRIFLLFNFLAMLAVLPSCINTMRSRNMRRPHSKPTPSLQTNVDLPPEIEEEKLTKIGISSAMGQQLAQKEEQTPPTPSIPLPEQNQIEQADAQTESNQSAQEKIDQKEEPVIEFHFENADLEVLINQISELFEVTFVADDTITPMLQGAKSVKGNKISFKTQQPLTKNEAWNLFITFLEIAGFSVISQSNPKIKRIVTIEAARKSPLPAYIGVSPSMLPDSDEMVRYVYFVENASLEMVKGLVDQLKSTSASGPVILSEMKGFMLTDKAYNIKSLMNIIKELDKVTMPQSMSVLKLRRADAVEVEQLYKSLAGMDDRALAQQRFFPGRKTPSASYFPDNVGIFAEKHSNSLILLGPADAIKRIEDFIIQSVDVELSQPYSPLHVIQIRYADAVNIAKIMTEVTKFGASTEAGKSGGVRGGDKYLKPMLFTAEPETNQLIVRGDYEDFLKAKEIIVELDAPQPQVAIEVLLLAVSLNEKKQLGAQIRSRVPGTEGLFGNVKFQTSGLFGNSSVVENPNGPGINRLLGNLLNLVSTGVTAGNTILSLGDSLSTWAIIQALETASNVQVLANPFLVATNKTPALVSLGEIRRVITGTIIGTQTDNTYGDAPAELKVEITPQINSDGMIVLTINVSLSQFVGAANPDAAVRTLRKIETKTLVANKEVIALGGLIQNNIENIVTKVPLLGDIPILGWLFKNKQKNDSKSNLLILISTRIIEPNADQAITSYTGDHITEYTNTLNQMYLPAERRDPINRWFFAPQNLNEKATDEFVFRQQKEAIDKAKLHKDIVTPIAYNKASDAAPISSKGVRA